MSQNVALLHRYVDVFNRRDFDAFLALSDAAIEFTPYERAVEGLGPYRGHDGVRTWWRNSLQTFPDLAAELHNVRAEGNQTLAHGRLYGTGAGSGAAFDRTLWLAHKWRDGKVLWWQSFDDETEALKAVGLEE